MKQGDFSIPLGALDQINRDFKKEKEKQIKDLMKKMNAAVTITWSIAHQRRPYITAAQAKYEGRAKLGPKRLARKTAGGKYYRVSDPNAEAGVPVRFVDGGTLQQSIKKEVTRKGDTVQGRVWTDLEYAQYLEYGTSKIQARPFMRPAYDYISKYVSEMFNKPV